MPDVVIADTSCLIVLSNIKELGLLQKLYGNIITTPDIARQFAENLPDWVIIKAPADHQKQQILALQVDNGEASAIVLALEMPGNTIILDDLQARKLAEQLGISITGTLGIIIKAKLNGLIPSIKPILNKIKQTNFRISPSLEAAALNEANE
jgi:predicted nucleic acid-binding protein